jgi:hypothetical protein
MDESGKPVVSLSHVLLHLNKVSTPTYTLQPSVQADAGWAIARRGIGGEDYAGLAGREELPCCELS